MRQKALLQGELAERCHVKASSPVSNEVSKDATQKRGNINSHRCRYSLIFILFYFCFILFLWVLCTRYVQEEEKSSKGILPTNTRLRRSSCQDSFQSQMFHQQQKKNTKPKRLIEEAVAAEGEAPQSVVEHQRR
jgi:hypothetical protein